MWMKLDENIRGATSISYAFILFAFMNTENLLDGYYLSCLFSAGSDWNKQMVDLPHPTT